MIILSLERLGAVHRQPNLSSSIYWLNQQILKNVPVYQSTSEIHVMTTLFPEGHTYPAGTMVIDANDPNLPPELFVDNTDKTADLMEQCRRISLPKGLGIYNGLNCVPFCFDPYRDLFRNYGFPYSELTDEDIRSGALAEIDVLVVPGGPDAGESYYAGLGEKGLQEIRDFVANGGGYVGSCAGAYLPLTGRESSPEQRMWLNIIPATDPEGLDYWRTGTGFVRLSLNPSSDNSVLYGLSYGSPSTVDVIYWEGPAFQLIGENIRVLATYQELLGSGEQLVHWKINSNQCAEDALTWTNPLSRERFNRHLLGVPAAIESTYKLGRLILFSFHPEFGQPALPWDSNPVHLFIINAIYELSASQNK